MPQVVSISRLDGDLRNLWHYMLFRPDLYTMWLVLAVFDLSESVSSVKRGKAAS